MISLKIVISTIIVLTCCFSIVYEYIELIEENLTIKLYSPLFALASFYIATILGVIYISKIFVILIILDLIHSNYESDIRLHDNLLEMKHFSPMEHVARCMTEEEYLSNVKGELGYEEIIREPGFETNMFYSGSDVSSHATGWCRNFRGFIQYRSLIDNQ